MVVIKKLLIACVALFIAFIAADCLVMFVIMPRYEDNAALSLGDTTKYTAVLSRLEEMGVDTSLPCAGSDTVSVVSDRNITLYLNPVFEGQDAAVTMRIYSGDSIELSFASFSDGHSGGWRKTKITLSGKSAEGYCTTGQLTRLYMAYLKQNGLEAQFEAETGKALGFRSAKAAIREIDRQTFQLGIRDPADYPVDADLMRTMPGFGAVLAVALFFLLAAFMDNQRYREYLRVWNEEGAERWKELYGDLPQFSSLKDSGARDDLRRIMRQRSLKDTFSGMFK